MSLEELYMLFEGARDTFEVENGQPTNVYLDKIRAVINFTLILAPYD